MAIDLNHDAVIAYLDEVLDAFNAGKITKEQARSELQTILAKAAMDNARDLSSSLSNFKQRWNMA
jgi:predicted RNA-binding protein associated with RNAse of E/G family